MFKKQRNTQQNSNVILVRLSLTAEYMAVNSKNSLFKKINKQQILNLIERSQLNLKKTKIIFIFRRRKNKISLSIFRI